MPELAEKLQNDPWKVLPAVTDDDRQWARANPGKFQYYVDPDAGRNGKPRWPEDYRCGWGSDQHGQITRAWVNPDYVPGPTNADMPLTNEFELVWWRVAHGHITFERFIELFSSHRFIMLLPEDDPTGARGWPTQMWHGKPEATLYSSAAQLPNDVNPWLRREITGVQVLQELCPKEGMGIHINPGKAGVAYTIPGTDFLDLWRQWLDRNGGRAVTD